MAPKQGSVTCVQVSSLRRAAWSTPARLDWQEELQCWQPTAGGFAAKRSGGGGGSYVLAGEADLEGQRQAPARVSHHRTWALLLLVSLLRCSCSRLLTSNEEPREEVVPEAAHAAGDRLFLKAGSLYQNDYMTLWSANGAAISVTLRVADGDRFELLVEHLNSKGGGSEGWFAVRGQFRFQELPDAPGQLRLVPEQDPEDGFEFDASLMDRPTAFACRCLKSVKNGLLGAIELTVDTDKDAVLVNPRAAPIKVLWSEPVVLRTTTEEGMWKEGAPEAADTLVAA